MAGESRGVGQQLSVSHVVVPLRKTDFEGNICWKEGLSVKAVLSQRDKLNHKLKGGGAGSGCLRTGAMVKSCLR